MNYDVADVTKILLAGGAGWTDVTAGSYHEGDRPGRTLPPVFWAEISGGATITGPLSNVLSVQIG